MKAMILAAGKGTRVRPITYTVPKPMIPLIRKPVMECIVDYLKSYGVRQIMVNTSFLSTVIEQYFRDGDRFGVDIAYSFEGELCDGELKGIALGSAGGMKRIQEFSGFFDETFIVLCGDALINVDLDKALAFHRERKSVATIILKDVPQEETSKYGVVKTSDNGQILEFQEKPQPEEAISTAANTGIYIFEPTIFDHIPANTEYDIGGELFPKIAAANIPFYGITLPFQWVDIGSVPDYWDATRLGLSGKIDNFQIPGQEIAPGIYCGINVDINLDEVNINGPVYIGSSTSIGKGCEINGPTVIGANCNIQAGAILNECIVSDYTRISSIANLTEKIIFGDRCINPDGSNIDIAESQIEWLVDDSRKQVELNEMQQLLYETTSALNNQNHTSLN